LFVAKGNAVPVYAPVFIVPTLLFQGGALAKAPLASALRVAKGIGRSCVFLSGYCTLAISFVCWGRNACSVNHPTIGPRSQLLGVVAGLLSGLANLVEKPARRIELGLYVLSQALRSAWACWTVDGAGASPLPPPARFGAWLVALVNWQHKDVLLFSCVLSPPPALFGAATAATAAAAAAGTRLLAHPLPPPPPPPPPPPHPLPPQVLARRHRPLLREALRAAALLVQEHAVGVLGP
jgi:hypothetical protein